MAKKKLFDEHGNEVKGKIKKPFYKKVWFWVLAVVLIGIIGGGLGDEDSANEPDTSEVTSSVAEKEVVTEPEDEVVADKEDEPEEKKKDDVPAEFKSALNKAKTYSDSMNMSKAGVYDQLTSEHGEKFSPEAGQYAIDNVEADWKANALAKGKTYQESMDMSPESVRDQLVSDSGEKFTQEEADYAVENLNK